MQPITRDSRRRGNPRKARNNKATKPRRARNEKFTSEESRLARFTFTWSFPPTKTADRAKGESHLALTNIGQRPTLARLLQGEGKDPMVADFIGPYRVVEALGQGAMGIVYRARHRTSERAVALKTVRVASPKLLEGIRREVRALKQIRHPGVVRIVDDGVHRGLPWYAMDLLEGESLRRFGQRVWSPFQRPPLVAETTEVVSATDQLSTPRQGYPGAFSVRTKPVPSFEPCDHPPAAGGKLSMVVDVVGRVCSTLAFLHGEGFVNCDLKPENILLVDAQPVIIDFGLSAHHPGRSGREALEAQPGRAGTIPYMSPEQIRGEFVDARSDLYAIGCLLYELVTGAPPFTGPSWAILTSHLDSPPKRPSELVVGVPDRLERLILRLLEKDVADRFGHADEVAGELAELRGYDVPSPESPPSRSYLYRPRLVGRDAILVELARLRDDAIRGSGALALLGGESGVGKTRVAMELTRLAPGVRARVVTSSGAALSAQSTAVGPSPLDSLRPLLQAVADRCQEGGASVTQRLLGDRVGVLSLYEPLLGHVPSFAPSTPPIPLEVEPSRKRLFAYLSQTIAALADEQPLLWVLDDLQWADELSLAFLGTLTGEHLAQTPLLVLCTYRTEEQNDAVSKIAQLSHTKHVLLPRLGREAVHSIVSDMLALRKLPYDFVEFLSRQSEGNPFFVAEYLQTAVTERVLFRDKSHAWRLAARPGGSPAEYDSLLHPRSLRELIEGRLRTLSPAAGLISLAAAVLGREADLETVQEVAALSEDATIGAVGELLRRQVLEQTDPGLVRFAHDKLREVAYAHADRAQLADLHLRAATVLERRWAGTAEASLFWAALGHHFVMGKRPNAAATYLKLAGDHARATHANGEAIRLYRQAMNQVGQILLELAHDVLPWQGTMLELHEALADVLSLTGQRDEGRTVYEQALLRMGPAHHADRARLYRKIGKTWETQHDHAEALRNYALARGAVAADPLATTTDARDEWIQVRVDQLWVFYWLNRVTDMDALSRELRPVVDMVASPLQRSRFLRTQWMRNLRHDRYVAREETVQFARAALIASQEGDDQAQLLADQFGMGFVLLFNQQVEAADVELSVALAMAERGGDISRQARCLAYLAMAARMQGAREDTRRYSEQGADVAAAAGMRDYVAAAYANRAWLSLGGQDTDGAIQYARRALDTWRSLPFAFPLQWLALVPLLDAMLGRGELEQAVASAQSILDPSQMLLSGAASDALRRAIRCWGDGDRDQTVSALNLALKYLEETGYR